ncbi:MAG: 50S ribosomal protein L3 [Sandaracinaceae bacterium]|nr:MAG: 50S ribosomal protein L3 [Sandaracinaceae bacterium]HBQ11963.1 50S ribosomal protein L3 [Myxococcales bacterium]
MNTHPGLIGKKLGNTQLFNEDGDVVRVTVLKVGGCTVLGKRTAEKDGYSALILGFEDKREKLVNKPEKGFFDKAGVSAKKVVREFRLSAEDVATFEVGQALKPSDLFSEGQFVDVSGQTKGRGFTGVMKRWNFAGAGTVGHGTHEYKRHGGSIGANMTPGRVLPGVKMPGQYGDERVTILNLPIARVMDDEGLLLVEGGVPGPRNGYITVRGAVKKKNRGKVAEA